ncbi:MAG: hypothetical protein ACOYM7_05525 [Paludibacter sp.]
MKKKIFLAVIVLLFLSCESKFDKTVKCLKSNIWVLDSQQKFTSANPIKIFEGTEKKIHRFTENSIYVYDSDGNFENIFSYEKINDKDDLKIIVKNLFSHNKEEYAVIAGGNILVLIGGELGGLMKVDFRSLKDENLKNNINKK